MPEGEGAAKCWRTVAAQANAEALYPPSTDTKYIKLRSQDVRSICLQREGEGLFISDDAFQKLMETPSTYPWPLDYESLLAVRGDDGGLRWITLQEPGKISWAKLYKNGTELAGDGAFTRSIDPNITLYIQATPGRVAPQDLKELFTIAKERSALSSRFEMVEKPKDDYFLVSDITWPGGIGIPSFLK